MSENNSNPISTDSIAATLQDLPTRLLQSDLQIAQAEKVLTELQESLELAEVNASLNAQCDGRDAPTRELQRKQAVSNDADVKNARSAMLNAKVRIESLKAENKQLSRQFAGLCHIAELRGSQFQLMSKGVTLQ